MADEIGPTSFVPDDLDEFAAFEDEMAMAEEDEENYDQAQMEAEQAAFEARMAGQSGPRKLDFAAYGLQETNGTSIPAPSRLTQSHSATQSLSQSLSLNFDGEEVDMTVDAVVQPSSGRPPATLTPFERERLALAAAAKVSPHPLATISSAGAPSVLPPLHRSISDLRAKVSDQKLYVYRRAPVVGGHLSVTNAKGDRVYITMDNEDEAAKKLTAHAALHRQQQMHRELGQMNVRNMLRQLDEQSNAAALIASKELAEHRAIESDPEDDERSKLKKRRQRKERLMKKLDEQDARARTSAKNKQLWVDKYAPKGYGDLLSPEQINREVLEWLKGWDTCVFGEKKSAAADAAAANVRTLDSQLLTNSVLSPGRKVHKKPVKLISEDGEQDIRPEHKVILLCGSPGLGKTTLAHILAKQAGYHPYEINASDDRNPAVLESKIRAATEMQSVSFGADHVNLPNCIIVDEIDGVGAEGGELGAIQMLLKIVQAEGKKAAKKGAGKDGEDADADGGESGSEPEGEDTPLVIKRKSKRTGEAKPSPLGPLRRPIICICNDQYAAALRPLRAVAKIFEFTTAPKAKFVDRLKFIASKEGMEYDPRTLGALADVVDMDIRSALNTLQFVHSKGQRLTAGVLNNLAVGRKDVEKSRFQVWDSVFCDREVKKDNILQFRDMRETERHNNGNKLVSKLDGKTRELLGMLSDAGDMDKIMEGIFHNYPSIPFPDPSFLKTVDCSEWLSYADLLDHRIQSEVEMSLMQYSPYPAIAIHHLTARPRKVMLENPTMFYTGWVENQRNVQIVKSFLSPTNCLTLEGVSINSTVLDVLPFVLDILHPTIRPVNYALLTSKEKDEMGNLIDTMLSLSMTYRPEIQSAFVSSSVASWQRPSADHATTVFKLEPQIDLLCEWTNPLDASSGKKFEPKDKFGNVIVKHKFGHRPAQPTQPSFQIDKRDMNMPGKVKQLVLRELEFEAMRRTEARIAEKNADAVMKDANRNDQPPPSPASFISPAVQRLLEEEKRKRDRATAATTDAKSPPGVNAIVDDESPAAKRAKITAGLNFLNAHADHAKNKQRRGRPNGAKLGSKLEGLKTEKENITDPNGVVSMDTSVDVVENAAPIQGASVLSRFTHPLHFKYNEGCTNAVRRTVHVAHFLPL